MISVQRSQVSMLELKIKVVKFQRRSVNHTHADNSDIEGILPDVSLNLPKADVDSLATRNRLIKSQRAIINESVTNHGIFNAHRSQSCVVQDNAIYPILDSLIQHPRFTLQTHIKSNAPSTSSRAVLRGASLRNGVFPRNSLTDISERFGLIGSADDPDYYHTVHGGHSNHITASRSSEPFAPITRVHIGDHNINEVDQANVETAYVARRSTTNLQNRQTIQKSRSSVVRPLCSMAFLILCYCLK